MLLFRALNDSEQDIVFMFVSSFMFIYKILNNCVRFVTKHKGLKIYFYINLLCLL